RRDQGGGRQGCDLGPRDPGILVVYDRAPGPCHRPARDPAAGVLLTALRAVQEGGNDLDGVRTQKPVKYKFIMLTDHSEFSLATARLDPASLRRYYAPRYWAGWDSLPGDTTQKQFTGLTPDQEYVFAVVAFDEVGAYSPIFDFSNTMIFFKVTYAGAQN